MPNPTAPRPSLARRVRPGWPVLLLLTLLASPAFAQLELEVRSAISEAEIGSAIVSVSVQDAESGTPLVSVADERPMIPASNMKLFTTGAALHVLGPDFSFRTGMRRDGDRIVVLGDGDPAFGDPELLPLMQRNGRIGIDFDDFLDHWVDAVVASGMPAVERIDVDDRIFDRDFVHPGWPADQITRPYCAEVSGMNVHLNILHVFLAPTDSTHPSIASVQPAAPWLDPYNEATCLRGPTDDSTAWITRGPTSNDFRIYGNVKFAYRVPLRVSLHDPSTFTARLLADRIAARGIPVHGTGLVPADAPPTEGAPMGPVITTPISTIVTRCNRDSENLYAESLLKRIGREATGRPGSWTNGVAIVRHVVHERLRQPALSGAIVVSDGSGLSRENRVTAEAMTTWLNSFHRDPRLEPIFVASLAEARRNGTMKKRFNGTELHGAVVQAKSGYINFVSCLSGYVTGADGDRRSFSILVNELTRPGSVRAAKRLQERIVSLVAKDMARVEVSLGSD